MKKITLGFFVALLFLLGVTVTTTNYANAEDVGTSIIWTDGTSQ